MGRRPKFRPVVTRVELNPEQAVLQCNCFEYGMYSTTGTSGGTQACKHNKKGNPLMANVVVSTTGLS